MDFSADNQLREALRKMADVLAYLGGSCYSPAGQHAALRVDMLTVRLPSPPSRRLLDPDGVTVQLVKEAA